jgi:hypothetical protein
MAENIPADATPWLAVIVRGLAYLCLTKAMEQDPDKYKTNFG